MNKLMSLSVPRLRFSEEIQPGTKIYDLIAASPLIVLFGVGANFKLRSTYVLLRQIHFVPHDFLTAVAVISNLSNLILTVLFIGLLVARRPALAGTPGILPRVAAIVGTYLAVGILQTPSRHIPSVFLIVSTLMEVGGTIFAIYSLAWLGRSVSMLAEARELVTGGPYAVVRHPLYLGEETALIGVAMQYFSPWTIVILLTQIVCQVYRMNCEESVLARTFPAYSAYKMRVARLIPGIY
jgi:protein-S-isoprenylcysteine O-methyltransferase Ste14